MLAVADTTQSILVVTVPVIAGGMFAVLGTLIQVRGQRNRDRDMSANLVLELARQMARETVEKQERRTRRPKKDEADE